MKKQNPIGTAFRAFPNRQIRSTAPAKCRSWLLAAAFLTATTIAVAATLVIEGEFTETKEVSGADVYDATNANAYVEQGTNNYGFIVRSSPNSATWLSGWVFGQGVNKTGAWRSTYDLGNGAGLVIHESPNFTVDGFYSEWSWDGIRPARNTSGDILIKRVWLNNIRDDAIEADHVGTWNQVRVENSLIEDVFVIHSNRRGSSATGPTPPHRVEYVGNLLSLGLHLMDLEKREYCWSGPIPGYVSGQTFKTEGAGTNMTFLFKNNVVKLTKAQAVAKSVLNILPANATIDPQSGGNTFVWLGGSPDCLEMETINGVLVPTEFKIDPNLWTVTDNETTWDNARSDWISNVWENGGTDTEPPTVNVTSPTNGATVSGTISVTASASDNVGVVGVQFKLDGNNLGSEDTSAPYTVSWDTTGASNSSHTLTAVARDAANNTTTSSSVTVTVDNSGGGSGTTIEFNPTEDTHIRKGQPDDTWGSHSYLAVRAGNSEMRGVMKFTITGVSGTVTGVKLRMHSENNSIPNTTTHQVTGSWSESTLTWNNSNLTWGSSIVTVNDISPNSWYEFDLGTGFITGNGTYTVGLTTTGTSWPQQWSSRESGSPPVLIVTVDGGNGGSAPGQANSPSPASSATGVDVNADLSWTAGSGATTHDVYFGTDSTPDSTEFKGNQTGTTFDPGTLANDTTYYWQIDEVNANGTTTGNVWSFTTAVSLPGQASSPSPSNGATNLSNETDLMSWTAGSGATSHDVYFGTDSTPDSTEFRGNQTATAFDPGILAGNTTYYWRIDEVNSAGTTTGSVWSFTTAAGSGNIAFVGASSATTGAAALTSITVDKPVGVVGGDFMLAGVSVINSVTITPPSGWTLIRTITDTMQLSIYSKAAGANEPASYTWTVPTTKKMVAGIVAFSGVDAATPIQVEDGAGHTTATSTAHATPTITTSGASTWLVSLFGDRTNGGSTWTPPSGAAERVDVRCTSGNNDPSLEINTVGPVAAGNKTHTATASGSSPYAGMEIIALNAALGGTSGPLIDNLTVNDSANAADWSVQSDLQSGDTQYGDRTLTWTTVPSPVAGCEWIRTAMDSKSYTGATLASFTLGATADVYVAHADTISPKPSWLNDWSDIGVDMVNSSGSVRSLFRKTFMSGATVNLGPNGDTQKPMYTVIVCTDEMP